MRRPPRGVTGEMRRSVEMPPSASQWAQPNLNLRSHISVQSARIAIIFFSPDSQQSQQLASAKGSALGGFLALVNAFWPVAPSGLSYSLSMTSLLEASDLVPPARTASESHRNTRTMPSMRSRSMRVKDSWVKWPGLVLWAKLCMHSMPSECTGCHTIWHASLKVWTRTMKSHHTVVVHVGVGWRILEDLAAKSAG